MDRELSRTGRSQNRQSPTLPAPLAKRADSWPPIQTLRQLPCTDAAPNRFFRAWYILRLKWRCIQSRLLSDCQRACNFLPLRNVVESSLEAIGRLEAEIKEGEGSNVNTLSPKLLRLG